MNNTLGKNIFELRKKNNLTQEDLATRLNVSFQAVSKWENGISFPDISLLPIIADCLGTSIDSLLNYAVEQRTISEYENRYNTNEYYWGVKPNDMCYEVLKLLPPDKPLKLLDIGCGEGKDAVFFAKNGYKVSAFDITKSGIDKARKLADKHNVDINFFNADILDFRLESEFDVLFCSGVLHFIPLRIRKEIFDNYKKYTSPNGINAFNVFVEKPFLHRPDHDDSNRYPWHSGELFSLYHNWLIESCSEIVFDCNSGGIPHKHCMNILIARNTGDRI